MNYFDLYSSYPDRTIAAAWDSQVKEADKTPWFARTLTESNDELFARFAACYAELRALPRSARRALQRQLARSTELAAILPEYLQQGGRRLQHRMAWSLAGAALLLALGQGVAAAATITVTTNNPNIASDGQCSLVEAIVNANNDAATHADCAAGSGADTIILPAKANVTLSNAYGTIYSSPIGLPLITSRITIEGNGATIARQGNAPAFGLLAVDFSADLTLQSITLSGGSSGSGGGVLNSGTLSIKDSTISGNTANFGGGGVYNYPGTLTVENSTISGNRADRGGGLFSAPNPYVWGISGFLTITNSTISGNTADQGGGVFNSQFCHGNPSFPGYDHCHTAALTLNRSLIAGNQAAAGPEIENSIVLHNFIGSPPLNNVTANNFNLFGSNGNAGVTGFSPGPTDIVPSVSVAQILGPLKNNGGTTQTHALVAGSPAIDAGDPGGCRNSQGALLLATDQRGFARHVDQNGDGTARCDIGAVEGVGATAIPVDFDGDGVTDIAVYRDGVWFIRRSSDGGMISVGWGIAQDIPVPADYDGDGKTDIAVYRNGDWFIHRSSDGGVTIVAWGIAQDIPVPADYDGDGKTDITVYRDGDWFIHRSSDGGVTVVAWGSAQDMPVAADYDGDGKTDIAVYRNGDWFIHRSSDGGVTAVGWGIEQDIPVPGNYDGDGKTDIAVYRSGDWFIHRSSDGGMTSLGWGIAQDIPVPADFDGDRKTDIAVYRDGTWFILRSSDGVMMQHQSE
jgi:hypothetical protein